LPILQLALFFQIPFRNTHHAILNTSKLALFFQIVLTAEFAENAEETKSPNQLHQREFLHIKNLRALGVLGGKTTKLALFFQINHEEPRINSKFALIFAFLLLFFSILQGINHEFARMNTVVWATESTEATEK